MFDDLTDEQYELRNRLVAEVYDNWAARRFDSQNIVRVKADDPNYDAGIDEIVTASQEDEADLNIRVLKAWKKAGVLMPWDNAPDNL